MNTGTKLGKNLGGAEQRQLARKVVQQISAPPTSTSTAEISGDGSTGLRLLASGRGAGAPLAPPLAPCLIEQEMEVLEACTSQRYNICYQL